MPNWAFLLGTDFISYNYIIHLFSKKVNDQKK